MFGQTPVLMALWLECTGNMWSFSDKYCKGPRFKIFSSWTLKTQTLTFIIGQMCTHCHFFPLTCFLSLLFVLTCMVVLSDLSCLLYRSKLSCFLSGLNCSFIQNWKRSRIRLKCEELHLSVWSSITHNMSEHR